MNVSCACRLEKYGQSFLERINDYDTVVRFFRGLNDIAVKIADKNAGITQDEINAYADCLRKNNVSDIALRAAVRINSPDADILKKAYKICDIINLDN